MSVAAPSGWRVSTLGECCQIVSGGTPKRGVSEYWGGSVPWVTPKDISGLDQPDFGCPPETISDLGLKKSSAALLPPGAILMSSRAPIGLLAIATQPMATNQGFKSLVPGPDLDSRFLYYAVKRMIPYIQERGSGATFKEVSKSVVSEIPIAFPKLGDQRRIATVLDKANGIRRMHERALAIAREFLTSVFQEMFGAQVFPTNSKYYRPISRLIDEGLIVGIQDGNHGEIHPKSKDFSDTGIPFVTANMLSAGKVSTEGAHHLDQQWMRRLRIGFAKPSDVLLTHKGSIGFTAIVDERTPNLILSPQVTYYRLNQDRLIPEYLVAYFRSGYFQSILQQFSKQSTRAYIGITRQKDLKILVPPLEQQQKFAALYRQLRAMESPQENSMRDAEKLTLSLSQRAFRGEL